MYFALQNLSLSFLSEAVFSFASNSQVLLYRCVRDKMKSAFFRVLKKREDAPQVLFTHRERKPLLLLFDRPAARYAKEKTLSPR